MERRKQVLFQQTFAATGCLAAAARAADIPLDAARRLKAEIRTGGGEGTPGGQSDAEELGRAVAALETEAVRRALSGVEVPVFHQGRECGNTVKHSDTLLMFLLKTLRPERYGPDKEAAQPGAGRAVLLDIDLSAGEEEGLLG